MRNGEDARKRNPDHQNDIQMETNRDRDHGFTMKSWRGHGFLIEISIRAMPKKICEIYKIYETRSGNPDC